MKIGAHLLKASQKKASGNTATSPSLSEESEDRGCEFTVWAPLATEVSVEIVGNNGEVSERLAMRKNERGYWCAIAPNADAGTRYRYRVQDTPDSEPGAWPDPASRYQPLGVHGPSEVIDHSVFEWTDSSWPGIKLADYIIYELHVATFTQGGTFESALERLPHLVDLGITAVEIMPVAQFPGARNWGYDGAFPYAVQNSYGGPDGLKKLVDACHGHGLAVIMDVVYNHFGPEGNYTGKFGPYTTDRYRTPWGNAINFDDAYSGGVRRYFIENALSWLRDYHIDSLRLDAVHAIYDFGAHHFLQALAEAVENASSGRSITNYLIAESDLNDPRLIRPITQGGYQLDGQWSDDFHHALHTRLTGEILGYYSDFNSLKTLADAIQNRFAYAGQYSSFRMRDHGSSAIDLPSEKFVVCSQNHDQVGNRMTGDRFSTLISFESQKLAAGATLLSPYIPLLFMGEEYGENAPFLYFVDHTDKGLIEAVRKGRTEEFRAFHSKGTPPDPAGLETFQRSVLRWPTLSDTGAEDRAISDIAATNGTTKNSLAQQNILHRYYKALIQVRKDCHVMVASEHSDIDTKHTNDILYYRRTFPPVTDTVTDTVTEIGDLLCIMNFAEVSHEVELPLDDSIWEKKISSVDAQWCISGHGADPMPDEISTTMTPVVAVPTLSITLYQRKV
ncbi:MAG: malto-oligosyltrehalose trehalohydrolase [Cyanobacteria bacterium P01_D01_bin.105]